MKITAKAQEYLNKKGNQFYIKHYNIQNGCVLPNYQPDIIIGIPKNKENYVEIEIDNVKVYLDKGINKSESVDLIVDLHETLGIKRLVLINWKVF